MNLPEHIKEFIKQDCLKDVSEERCGVIANCNGVLKAIPCQNISPNPSEHFVISPLDLAEIKKTSTLLGYYHSHLDNHAYKLSKYDRLVSSRLNLYSIIYCIKTDKFNDFQPHVNDFISYLGRPFVTGIFDCYTLVQDYYRHELNIKLTDPLDSVRKIYEVKEGASCPQALKPFYDSWDFSDPNELENIIRLRYDIMNFGEISQKIVNGAWLLEHFLASKFNKVNNIRKGDVILVNLPIGNTRPTFPTHCLISLGGNEVIHHPYGKESERLLYGKYLNRETMHVLRHELMK